MKTFKLVAFHIEDKKGELVEIPVEDALIINKENDNKQWLIEIFIKIEYLEVFSQFDKTEEVSVQVVITHRDNAPAHFVMKLKSLKELDQYASILLEGTLDKNQNGYAEQLLESLLVAGLSGDELLSRFQEQMKDKKDIRPTKKLK